MMELLLLVCHFTSTAIISVPSKLREDFPALILDLETYCLSTPLLIHCLQIANLFNFKIRG